MEEHQMRNPAPDERSPEIEEIEEVEDLEDTAETPDPDEVADAERVGRERTIGNIR
jgi:hypothetical protein